MKDIMGMMKKVGEMQARLKDVQEELARAEFDGVSGGGLLKVVLDGKGELKNIRIDPSLMKDGEADVLEDLIMTAVGAARAKSDAAMKAKMADVTEGLPIPPGMKLF